jgi:hypothetical protein
LLQDTGNGDGMNLEEVARDFRMPERFWRPSRQGPWRE